MSDAPPHPIDAVIAWVDGSDPAHAAKRARYVAKSPDQHADAISETRFDSRGEIYVCVASILKFLPWIRKIWIVTDDQKPRFLDSFVERGHCAPDRIGVVDHFEILGDFPNVLPTFNSVTIEAALWRIPGLADRHIYFNDDMFVNRPMDPTAFFGTDGPVLRGDIKPLTAFGAAAGMKNRLLGLISPARRDRPSFKVYQQRGARLAGRTDRYVHQGHWPQPMLASTLADYYSAQPDVLAKQIRHRFRHASQHWPVSVAHHLIDADPKSPPKVAYLRPGRAEEASIDALLSDDADFGCMQSLDRLGGDKAARLFDGLVQKFDPFLDRDALG